MTSREQRLAQVFVEVADTLVADSTSRGTLFSVGQVAELLGIPAVTLRSWERRYDIGPSQRSPGQHRRYNRADVERLQRMRNLIAAGMPAREAAPLSAAATAGTDRDSAELWSEHEAQYLVDLASSARLQLLADELQSCLTQRGVASAWDQVIRPGLRILEARQLATGDCTDIELVLTQAVSEAVDRHTDLLRARAGDAPHPVLLICSPGERHYLPLKILQGALLDQAVPTVFLGPGLPVDAAIDAITRITPSVVVLWALVRRRELMKFHRTITSDGGVVSCAAGPGWPHSPDPATTLDSAIEQISELWLTANSGAATSGQMRRDT
ncbi:MerR family transcriptional regulator [Kribbella sp. NPDC051952]|uniref:MerR family transcriptional regulator n=1 Tax=Kribbella sp. NPDC051952 TaxID=3154851 RepID=UPI00341E688C